MRKWLVFILLLLTVNILTGQVNRSVCVTICDSTTNQVIPYCNIMWYNNAIISNDKGTFCISKKDDKDILVQITNISYKPYELVINNQFYDTVIYLVPKLYYLPEVTFNLSDYKFITVGNRYKQPHYYYNLWRFCQTGLVIKPLKKELGIIEEISVPIYNPDSNKVPFRLHIFSINDNGNIDKELLPQNVYGQLVESDKEVVKINVLKYQISVPDNGFIVTIELLSNNQPNELLLKNDNYYEEHNNRIAFTKGNYKNRKLKKISSWKPNSFYIESYPFTNVEGIVGDLPLINVKIRKILFQ